jgi:hypothetical protein
MTAVVHHYLLWPSMTRWISMQSTRIRHCLPLRAGDHFPEAECCDHQVETMTGHPASQRSEAGKTTAVQISERFQQKVLATYLGYLSFFGKQRVALIGGLRG